MGLRLDGRGLGIGFFGQGPLSRGFGEAEFIKKWSSVWIFS